MTPETSVKHQVRDYLRLRGWFTYHNLAGLGCYPGLSDMVAIRAGVVLFIECKANGGRQSDKQRIFEENIVSNGGHYILAYCHEDIERYLHENGIEKEYCKQENLL